ncbi:MAG: TolC family protein [Bacteroidetes bacterium]|jgi:cobalt-zinc-cadmium efflux system outer membrane protein|nr:TolC family protein [Bacteroidota bacterium]
MTRFQLFPALMLLLIGLWWAPALTAQPTALPDSLDFAQAKALMLEHNPALRAAQAQSTQQSYAAALPTLWPNPSLRVSQDRIPLPGGGIDNQLFFSLGQTVPYPGIKRAQERAADHLSDAAAFRYDEAAARAFRDLRERYVDVVAAEARVETLRELTEAVRTATRAADVRYQEGDVDTFGRARLRVALADFENDLAEAETAAAHARRRLAAHILPDDAATFGDTGHSDYAVVGSLRYRPVDAPYDSLRLQALARRGLLNAATARVDARAQQLRAAQLQRIPSLSLSAGPKLQDTPGGTAWGYTAGISLQIPLWNTGGTQVRAREAEQQQAQALAEETRRAVELQVREAYAQVQSYQQRIARISEGLLVDTDALLQDARYVYAEGELSLVGLLDAMQAARSARTLKIDLLAGHLRSLYALEYALGVGPTDDPPLLRGPFLQSNAAD